MEATQQPNSYLDDLEKVMKIQTMLDKSSSDMLTAKSNAIWNAEQQASLQRQDELMRQAQERAVADNLIKEANKNSVIDNTATVQQMMQPQPQFNLGDLIAQNFSAFNTKQVGGIDYQEPTPWLRFLQAMTSEYAPGVSKMIGTDIENKQAQYKIGAELAQKMLPTLSNDYFNKATGNTALKTQTGWVDSITKESIRPENLAKIGAPDIQPLTGTLYTDTAGNPFMGILTGGGVVNVDTGSVVKGAKPKKDTSSSDANRQLREEMRTDQRLDDFGKKMSPALAVRSTIGVAQQGLARIKRLQALANDPSKVDPNNLPQIQTEELAIGLNAILQGSNQSAKTQVEKLVPQSMQGNVNMIKSWIFNKPFGLEQQEFIKLIKSALEREEQANTKIIHDLQRTVIPSYTDLESDPRFETILGANGFTWEEYQQLKKNKFLPQQENKPAQTTVKILKVEKVNQ